MNNSYSQIVDRLNKHIDEYYDECVELSDFLGKNPEISGEEYSSSKLIASILEKNGFNIELPYADIPTAFKAVGSDKYDRNICILTEYDALPEVGHACGHNVSAAISLLASLALVQLQDELKTNIHVIGTPREESDGAKCIMAEQGCFDNYDMAMMVHLYDSNCVFPKLYALDLYEYTFSGVSSHSAVAPWEGKNALNGVMLTFHALDMLRQHVKPDVRIHGIIKNGGQYPNMVPSEASCEIYVRSLNREYLNSVVEKVEDCVAGAALATQTTYKKGITGKPNHNLQENKSGIEILQSVYDELNLPTQAEGDDIFGSSDVGDVSRACPTFHPTLQIADQGTALHTEEFAEAAMSPRAHEAIRTGARIIGMQAIKIFSDEANYRSVMDDFTR